MPSILTFRRGTAAQNDAFTGSAGEITVDNTNGTLRVHDGVTAGGSQLATVDDVNNIDLTPYATTSYVDTEVNNIDLSPYATTTYVDAEVAGAGKVKQFAQVIKTDAFSTTTAANTWVDVPGLQANITPTSASSYILVMASVSYGVDATQHYVAGRLVRNGSVIHIANSAGSRTRATFGGQQLEDDSPTASIHLLDQPGTTATVSYKIQLTGESGRTKFVNRGRGADGDTAITQRTVSSIVLLELGS